MVSPRIHRLCIAIAAVTVAAVVACGASSTGHPAATATPKPTPTSSAADGIVIPPDAVPWAALPIQPYLPTPLPGPTAKPVPRCSLNDFTSPAISTGGATGNDAVFFSFTNRTSHPCLTGGYPRVILSQPGMRTIVATPGGFWDEGIPPSDLGSGASASFDIGFSFACETSNATQLYEHVSVTLPGGGSFTTLLTSALPAGTELRGVFGPCGVTVSALSTPTPRQVYPLDPLLQLTVTMTVPTAVQVDKVFMYLITLFNPTSEPVALDPCRGFYQRVDTMKSPFFAFELNCAAAHPIPANGGESFVIEMTVEGLSPGMHMLQWNLDTDGTPGPQSSVGFRVVS